MSVEFRLPDLGEGITEAEIVRWLVADGESVKQDQGVLEVETDKAIVEVPAPENGIVRDLRGKPGDMLHVGDLVFVVEAAGAPISAAPEPALSRVEGPVVAAEPAGREVHAVAAAGDGVAAQGTGTGAAVAIPAGHVRATPAVRKLARDLGLDISAVTGSGADGRVLAADVTAAGASDGAGAPPPVTDGAERLPTEPVPTRPRRAAPVAARPAREEGPDEEYLPLIGIRRRIAEAMTLSKRTIPHITGFDEFDATALMAVRERLKARAETAAGVHLTYLPFVVKAAVTLLKRYPRLNAGLDMEKGEITLKRRYHVGIATATDEGLIVPVVHDADRKSVLEIAAEIATLTEEARNRRIALEKLQGGTFTVTNFGSLGGWHGTPLIRPGQCAILGTGRIQQKPVVVDGQIVIRPMMAIDFAADHRLVDGDILTGYLRGLIAVLEEPSSLLLELA